MARSIYAALTGDQGVPTTWVGAMRVVGALCCVAIALFIVSTLAFGRFPAQMQYGIVLTLALVAIFMLKPGPLAKEGSPTRADALLTLFFTALTLFSGIYFLFNYDDIAAFREGIPNTWDLVAYALGTLAVLEGARRAEGWLLLGVALAAFAYMLFGEYMPGVLYHRPFTVNESLEVAYSYQGIYGVALAAVVDVVYIFVILGVALRITGAGDFFNYVSLILTRGRRSGAAQCAIIASALFGSVNGSAPANVSATGVLTIPMMKNAGYQARFAGAVEATASCVGQVLPPIMGVGAFIMSEITGIPYVTIMLAAVVPAFLFILSLSISVALEAGRLNIAPLEVVDTSWTKERIAEAVILLTGFGTLMVMLFSGFPPTYCGLIATGVVIGVAFTFPAKRPSFGQLVAFVRDGGRDGLSVALSCAAIGIVIGAVTTTGIGIKLNQLIVALGESQLLYALVIGALCSIIIGMGLPTAASYLMVIFVAGPAIMKLGVGMLSTHLFVFYYAVLSAITPPVALAVFAAAAIAKENPLKLAATAIRLALVGFLIPIVWIYHPEILLTNVSAETVIESVTFLAMVVIAMVALNASHIGFLRTAIPVWQRLLLAAIGIAILYPQWTVSITAAVLALAIFGLHIRPVARESAS